MLKVIAQGFIRPDRLSEVAPLYRELVDKTRQEPLCISYELFINQKDVSAPSSPLFRGGQIHG